jgi:hypothetical protein
VGAGVCGRRAHEAKASAEPQSKPGPRMGCIDIRNAPNPQPHPAAPLTPPQLSTKLIDVDKWKDSLKLTYDFMNRNGGGRGGLLAPGIGPVRAWCCGYAAAWVWGRR